MGSMLGSSKVTKRPVVLAKTSVVWHWLDRVFNPIRLGLTFQHDAAGQDGDFGNFLIFLFHAWSPFLDMSIPY